MAVVAAGDVVRVAFLDGRTPYLIPFGYVWMDSAMYGVTDPGKKTELAAANPEVAFQIDTSSVTGLFEWESVTGVGRFEIVEDPAERGEVLASLEDFVATAPDWWRDEQVDRMKSGHLLAWRLTPSTLTGARYARR
jgi:nitroimidazol reductase NimA-like FMN-containing flavoprotein (pyridoxamine 5'-phosphate oxidase superfamily)